MKIFQKIYRKINKLPKSVRIDACSICQLNCRDCFMRTNKIEQNVVGQGYLKFQDFKNFIDKNKYIENIELSMSGEIFLNPDLKKIIEYAYIKKVNLTACNGVNFNNVSDEILEALVKYKFRIITFSIDGVSDNTYLQYRKNGNYDKVIENIQKLNEYKNFYKSKFPILTWQFILFKHNQTDIEKAIITAKNLKMTGIFFKEAWNKELLLKDTNLSQSFIPFKPMFDKEIQYYFNINRCKLCEQPFISPQINWDGRLLGCCCATFSDLGVNVFDIGLKKALNSKKMKEMRNLLSGRKISANDISCLKCDVFDENIKKNYK